MPAPPAAPPPKAAAPTRRTFDPWNSSSTGHQRAENRLAGSTAWRDSRTLKLGRQFSGGAGGGARVADTVGAGSEAFGRDGRSANGGWERGAAGLRGKGQLSLGEAFGVVKAGRRTEGDKGPAEKDEEGEEEEEEEEEEEREAGQDDARGLDGAGKEQRRIFDGLCVYVNGSTAPAVSDHRLKHLLVTHGASLSISLGRRTVTHVVLGRPNGALQPGAGGGLAASKMQKEMQRAGARNVRFVTVEWVLESLKTGKRVPEQRFEAVRLAQKGTGRVGDMFARAAAAKNG